MASPALAGKAKPDAIIKEGAGAFKGKNVYSPPSPVDADQTLSSLGDGSFTMKIKNRGTKTDKYTIKGVGALVSASRDIDYDGTDVDSQIYGVDGFKLKLAPGKTSKAFAITHNVGGPGSLAVSTITATSRNNPSKADTVAVSSVGTV